MDRFFYTMGKRFKIRHVAKSIDEANQFCIENPDVGVIDSADLSRIIVADLKEIKTTWI